MRDIYEIVTSKYSPDRYSDFLWYRITLSELMKLNEQDEEYNTLLIKKFNGYIISDRVKNCSKLPKQLQLYFKLKNLDLKLYHGGGLRINGTVIDYYVRKKELSLNEYIMIDNILDIEYNIDEETYADCNIYFDNEIDCKNFSSYLENEYKIRCKTRMV